MFAGHYGWSTPAGYSIGLTYYMMWIALGASLVAFLLMMYGQCVSWLCMSIVLFCCVFIHCTIGWVWFQNCNCMHILISPFFSFLFTFLSVFLFCTRIFSPNSWAAKSEKSRYKRRFQGSQNQDVNNSSTTTFSSTAHLDTKQKDSSLGSEPVV